MKRVTRYLAFGAVAFAAATMVACGGGSNGSGIGLNPSAQSQQAIGVPRAAVAQTMSESAKKKHPKKGQLKIELRIPRDKKKHHRFRPGYISAATESMAVTDSNAATQIFNLTPGSPGCSTTSGYVTCDVSAFFPSGSQTISVTLYDQTGGQGNALSTATTTANIVAGSITYISVTLEGVVATAEIRVNGQTTASVPEGVATTLPVTVSAYDADGHLIIAPGGFDTTTPVTLTDSDTSGATSIAPASISGPGVGATLSYNGGTISSATITAKVAGTAQANPITLAVVATASPTPSPTPAPQVSPASLSFSSGASQTISVKEPNYTGTLTATSGNTTVATVSPASGNGPSATFTVQPIGGGTTSISISDSLGNTATVNVSVNGGVIVIDQTPTATPTSLTFDTSASQTFSVHEKEYYGTLTESDSCSGIASTSPGSASGPTATFTVTPVTGGSCTVSVSDDQGNSANVGISISGGTITINNKHVTTHVRGGN
jgi:hypothetical protein